MEEKFLFMEDNARLHTANIMYNWLDEVGIEKMIWPANFSNGNPIEHTWDVLERRIAP